MTIDQDILNTLKRIEGLLKSQSAAAPSVKNGKSRIAGGASDSSTDKIYKATAASFKGVSETADQLNKSFIGLNRTVLLTRANFVAMNKSMRSVARQQNPSARNVITPSAPAQQARPAGTIAANRHAQTVSNNALATSSRLVRSSFFALAAVADDLTTIFKTLANDAFFLAARGLGASEGLKNLYGDAIKAGMSMRDYTDALGEAMPSVLRAASFDDYASQLDVSRKQLAAMGIFGEEASRLSIGLANITTTIGVSQASLTNAVAGQNSVFAQLRKTTMMTAKQFHALTQDLSENSDVQGNLIGLGQSERAARFNQIIQLQTLGLRLGATEKASKALGDALLAQRQSSLAQRFEAQGLARQAAAAFGMDAGQAERLSMLSRRKNLTADEGAEMQRLAASLNARLQQAMNSGNVNQEFMAEQFIERMGSTNLGRLLQASGEVNLTEQSGEIKAREQFGKGADKLLVASGQLLTYANGISKNPAAMAAIGIVSTGLGFLFAKYLGPMVGIARALRGTLSSSTGLLKSILTPKSRPTRGPGMMSKIGKGISGASAKTITMLKSASGVISNSISSLWNTLSKPAQLLGKAGNVLSSISSSASTFLNGFTGLTSKFGKGFRFVTSGFNKVSSIFNVVRKAASSLFGGIGNLVSGIGKVKTVLPFLSKIGSVLTRATGLISGIFGAIGEFISGDLDTLFNSDTGTWTTRIGNIIFGAITSVFGGIFDLVDSVIGLFTDDGEGFGLRRAFDQFATLMRGGFFSVLASVTSIFGNNKLSRYFEEAAENSYKVLDELRTNEDSTLSSLAEKRKKDLQEAAKTAKANEASTQAIVQAVNASAGIATSTTGLAASAVQHARAISVQSTPNSAPIKQVSVPASESATQTSVNKADQLQSMLSSSSSSTTSNSTDLSTVANLLQTAITLLQTGNQIMEDQSVSLNSISRSASRAHNQDSTVFLNRLANLA